MNVKDIELDGDIYGYFDKIIEYGESADKKLATEQAKTAALSQMVEALEREIEQLRFDKAALRRLVR